MLVPGTAFEKITPGKSASHLARWLYTDTVVHGISDLLLAAKVALSGLHRDVPEQKLDLFKFTASNVTEPGACAPQVMRRYLFNSDVLCEVLDDVPDHFFRESFSPNGSSFIDRAKQTTRYSR
jgi:hypothetical protein